ncbi:MAG: hypothetical protein ACTSV3_06945 [Candidatus Thorarchaeota archaeon]|nr:MAG: hypothetical protein DRP09_01245 [Candidatus Thorarchaeota archaeon]RLI59174.1 MAG: hypothetical protein DRO87_03695 [Candidatus Thorarchaeota archaeon]
MPFPLLLSLSDFPFNQSADSWLSVIDTILNVFYALAVRGYLLLVLLGFIVYATGLSDGSAKGLVAVGVFIYLFGPPAVNFLGSVSGIDNITMDSATRAWIDVFQLSDMEVVALLVWVGELVAALCCLTGAILYFTPTSGEMTTKGRTLIIRALMISPILVFFHMIPYL